MMHCFLKWIIYAAIGLFALAFALFLAMAIRQEVHLTRTNDKILVDSVAYELKCAQDSLREEIISSVESNAVKLDSMATIIHKVESVSKEADIKIRRKYDNALKKIDSVNCCP